MKLYTFKETYAIQIRSELTNGVSLDKYNKEEFDFDTKQVKEIEGFELEDGLCDKLMLDYKNDARNAIILHKALKDIPPILASKEPFWAYLCHAVFFKYVKARWKDKDLCTYFFLDNHKLAGNALSRLWWGAYYSIDNSLEDEYELTKILMKESQLFASIMTSSIGRYKDATLGILDFFKLHNSKIFHNRDFEVEALRIFNRIGGAKLLSSLPRDYFTKKLEEHFADLVEEERNLKE